MNPTTPSGQDDPPIRDASTSASRSFFDYTVEMQRKKWESIVSCVIAICLTAIILAFILS